ncbi:MAG: hypothetical protein AAF899_03460 [Pseudomonadota bacterium]
MPFASVSDSLRTGADAFLKALDPTDPFFWAAVWLILFAWVRRQAGRIVKSDGDRAVILRFFEEDRAGAFYHRNLKAVLDWLDTRLAPGMPSCRWPSKPVQRAWSGPLFDLTLQLAVAYPLTLLIIHWIATGDAGRIGGVEVTPTTHDLLPRIITATGLIVALSSAVLARHAFFRVSESSGVVFLILLAFLMAIAAAMAAAIAAQFAAAIAVVLTLALAYSMDRFERGGPAAAAAVMVTLMIMAIEVIGADTEAPTASFIAMAVLFIVAIGGYTSLLVAADATTWFGLHFSRPALALGLLVVVLMATIGIMAALIPVPDYLLERGRSLLLFLCLLPLANATADFLSIGLTRYLLRHSLTASTPWRYCQWLVDLVLGLVILMALGAAIVLGGHWIRLADGTPIMDVAGTLQGLRTDPWSYTWLIAGVATTVVPTLLHALLGAASAGILLSSRAIVWLSPGIVQRLKEAPKEPPPRPVLIGVGARVGAGAVAAATPQPIIGGWMLSLLAALVGSAIVGAMLAIAQIVLHLPVFGAMVLRWLSFVATVAGADIPAV